MKLTSLSSLAALVLIGLGGFMAGRISSPDATPEKQEGPARAKSSRYAAPSAADGESAASSAKSSRVGRAASLSKTSPADRLSLLEGIVRSENPLDRNRSLLAFIDSLGPGDFEQAVGQFRELGMTESRMGEYALLLSAWAKADPSAALEYTTANTGSRFATHTILSTWATVDPEAAIRWAETHHEGDGANPHMAGVIRGLAATDPQRATQLLTSMPKSQERGESLDVLLPHILTKGTEATRAWIESIQDDSLRNGAMMRSADKLAASDPVGTAAWLLANPSEATQRRFDDVYSVWARKDEQAAMTSLAALPSGENRSNALRGVVSSVAIHDPKAAVSVMDRFPDDVTDRVVQNFIWHSFGKDPSEAVNQISRITDEKAKERMYDRTLEAWFERDAEAATQWMRTNALPAPVLERLNRRINEQKQ